MKTFSTLLTELKDLFTEAPQGVVWTFGRFQVPTEGHQKLIDKVQSVAKKNNMKSIIFPSQTQDAKRNPLSFKDKTRFMKKLFKKSNISIDTKIKTPFQVLEKLNDDNVANVIMVVGSDRVNEFKTGMQKFIDKDLPNIKNFQVVSAGDRDPDAEGVTGISGSKMREFAKTDNFKKFLLGLPSGANLKLAQQMFDAVKKGLGIK